MKRIIAAILAGTFLAALAGCNTMAGVGEDTQAAGKSLERSAEKHKGY